MHHHCGLEVRQAPRAELEPREKRDSVPCSEPADVLPVQHDHREARGRREEDGRPRLVEEQAADRERDRRRERGERRVPEQHERHDPDDEADARGERREREHDPARRRDHLAALAEAEPDRARVAEHRRGAGEHADPLAAELDADDRGDEALGDVEQRHRARRTSARRRARRSTRRCSRSPARGCPRRWKSRTTTTPNGIEPIR